LIVEVTIKIDEGDAQALGSQSTNRRLTRSSGTNKGNHDGCPRRFPVSAMSLALPAIPVDSDGCQALPGISLLLALRDGRTL
jgi:hypothetical protein